jgi:ZIP family zinc transporter
MINFVLSLHPVLQAEIATLFTWSITMIGASLVYFIKNINKNLMDGMLGFAGGVMIAASFFSLISPAITMAENLNLIPWLVTFIGFFSGGVLLFIGDKMFDLYEKKHPKKKREDKKASLKRCFMLIFSITLHNIPEGMVILVH